MEFAMLPLSADEDEGAGIGWRSTRPFPPSMSTFIPCITRRRKVRPRKPGLGKDPAPGRRTTGHEQGAGRVLKRTDPKLSRSVVDEPSAEGTPRIGTGLEADILRGAGDGEETW